MNRFHYATTKDPNLLYLLKPRFQISDPFFYLETSNSQRVFLSGLDIGAFAETGNSEIEAVDDTRFRQFAREANGDRLTAMAEAILNEYEVKEVSVPSNFPYGLAKSLEDDNFVLNGLKDWCPERRQKTPEEISAIRENFVNTTKAYEYIEAVLSESEIVGDTLLYRDRVLTSEYLKREVRKLLLEYDLENPAGLVISCGKEAAMPHHEGSGLIRPGETIIVDIFPQSTANNYFADMTRTYVKGIPLHKEVTKMFEAVKAAQDNAFKALRPGVACSMPYEISAGIIERAGFDVGEKGYIHSLGHGLGVGIHEAPNLSPKAEGMLEVGDVVTIEPGLYYPEWGGVRLEDTVVITEDGYENLTKYPRQLLVN